MDVITYPCLKFTVALAILYQGGGHMHVSWLQVSFKSTILKNISPYLNVKYIHKTISMGMSPDGDFQGNWTSTCHAALKDKTPG